VWKVSMVDSFVSGVWHTTKWKRLTIFILHSFPPYFNLFYISIFHSLLSHPSHIFIAIFLILFSNLRCLYFSLLYMIIEKASRQNKTKGNVCVCVYIYLSKFSLLIRWMKIRKSAYNSILSPSFASYFSSNIFSFLSSLLKL
jgi:hypothetical protein